MSLSGLFYPQIHIFPFPCPPSDQSVILLQFTKAQLCCGPVCRFFPWRPLLLGRYVDLTKQNHPPAPDIAQLLVEVQKGQIFQALDESFHNCFLQDILFNLQARVPKKCLLVEGLICLGKFILALNHPFPWIFTVSLDKCFQVHSIFPGQSSTCRSEASFWRLLAMLRQCYEFRTPLLHRLLHRSLVPRGVPKRYTSVICVLENKSKISSIYEVHFNISQNIRPQLWEFKCIAVFRYPLGERCNIVIKGGYREWGKGWGEELEPQFFSASRGMTWGETEMPL